MGELLQDRGAAINEIERLRSLAYDRTTEPSKREQIPPATRPPAFRAGTVIRLKEVCEMLGLSRSTIYKLLSENKFPKPVHLALRSVRWRVEDVESWRDARGLPS